jgi:hypothetical protein
MEPTSFQGLDHKRLDELRRRAAMDLEESTRSESEEAAVLDCA